MGAALATGREFTLALEEAEKEAALNAQRKGHNVIKVETLSHNTKAITFETSKRLDFRPGGHLTIRSSGGYSRSYTPYLVNDYSFTIAVKRYEGGRVSPFLCDLKSGEFVTTSEPIEPLFDVITMQAEILLLVAGGTGTAPLYSMAMYVAKNHPNTRCIFFACFRNEEDVLLGDELIALSEASNGRMMLYFVFSQANPLRYKGVSCLSGRFDSAHLIGRVRGATYAIVCGPKGFGNTVSEAIESTIKIEPDNIIVM